MRRLKVKNGETATAKWSCPFPNTNYRYSSITLISGVHVYTQNNNKRFWGICNNSQKYFTILLYNDRFTKFYCTYIVSTTSLISNLQCHNTRYSHILNSLSSFPYKVQQPMQYPLFSFEICAHTDDPTYKNRCCLVS